MMYSDDDSDFQIATRNAHGSCPNQSKVQMQSGREGKQTRRADKKRKKVPAGGTIESHESANIELLIHAAQIALSRAHNVSA
jgi:hypothetical protein